MSHSRCSSPRETRGGGVTGLLAECLAVVRQTNTTVIGSQLQRKRLQLAAETDMLPHTDTDHGLLSEVKWRDIGLGHSLHGRYLFIAWRGRDARVTT